MAETEKPEDWVFKVRRNGGGYSILDITTKERAEELAAEYNFQYQTDNYYAERYREVIHEDSNHGES